jgi:hypothetical protein
LRKSWLHWLPTESLKGSTGSGEKWFRNQKCVDSIQLNVFQEVWDLIEDGNTEEANVQSGSVVDECFMALSEAAAAGKEAPRTLKLSGFIQYVEVLILGVLIVSLVSK